jgi:hypothetical protein
MEIIAFFRERHQAIREATSVRTLQNANGDRFIQNLDGLLESIYVLVNDKGTLGIKHVVGEFEHPKQPGNMVMDVQVDNASTTLSRHKVLTTFVDVMLDDAFEVQRAFARDDENVKAIELTAGVFDTKITYDTMNYVGTMLNVDTYSMNVKTIAAIMMISDQRIENIFSHVGVVNETSDVYKLIHDSNNYVAEHPNDIVWLTQNYYMKYKETNLQSSSHNGTVKVFVERM